MFGAKTFYQYAPDPYRVHDAHSIYFEVMGEHGFIGFMLFIILGVMTWIRAQQVTKRNKYHPEYKWASDLTAMTQVSLVGYATGGAFLGLAYFDLPYHLLIIVVLAAKFTGVLSNTTSAKLNIKEVPRIHPSSRWTEANTQQK